MPVSSNNGAMSLSVNLATLRKSQFLNARLKLWRFLKINAQVNPLCRGTCQRKLSSTARASHARAPERLAVSSGRIVA